MTTYAVTSFELIGARLVEASTEIQARRLFIRDLVRFHSLTPTEARRFTEECNFHTVFEPIITSKPKRA